jgi:hypothetical protein
VIENIFKFDRDDSSSIRTVQDLFSSTMSRNLAYIKSNFSVKIYIIVSKVTRRLFYYRFLFYHVFTVKCPCGVSY